MSENFNRKKDLGKFVDHCVWICIFLSYLLTSLAIVEHWLQFTLFIASFKILSDVH